MLQDEALVVQPAHGIQTITFADNEIGLTMNLDRNARPRHVQAREEDGLFPCGQSWSLQPAARQTLHGDSDQTGEVTETKRLMRTKSLLKWCLIILALAGFLAVATSGQRRERSKDKAFQWFFSKKPDSGTYVNHASERSVLGGGSFVLIFKLSETGLRPLLEQEGYKAIAIDSDPNHWRLDLCNSVIKRLTESNIEILSSFDCYSRETEKTHTRLFYDRSQQLVIVVGFGGFAK